MITCSLGTHGPEVSAIGLGCSGMSNAQGVADDTESIATIHAALDSGITLPILCADLAPIMWTFIVSPALTLTYSLKRPLALSRIW